jgi:hypothetical protein
MLTTAVSDIQTVSKFTDSVSGRLTETQVRARLSECENADVINELYSFGQFLLAETLKSTKDIDTKATSMATYGSALITVTVATSQYWITTGVLSAIFASICAITALGGTIFAVLAIRLTEFEWLSEREWLQDSCFSAVGKLKKYRILTMWGVMDSHKKVYATKVVNVALSQRWLSIAVLTVFLLLLNVVRRRYLY